jgi:hypothetical protein
MKKPIRKRIKPNSMANLRPPWAPGEAPKSPGRPPLPQEVKDERKILKAGSSRAAERLIELVESTNERNAIRAAEIVLSKTVPTLTKDEAEKDDNPFRDMSPELLQSMTLMIDNSLATLRDHKQGGEGTKNGH